MFDNLSEKLQAVFKKLKGHGKLNEGDIKAALREVRLALLEGDVHFKVVRDFIDSIHSRAIGQEVMASLTPAQQVIKIVHQELASLIGEGEPKIHLSGQSPIPVMLVGLHGCGKTTTAAKLAVYFKGKRRFPYLVPADVYRPAAIQQLQLLAEESGIEFYESNPAESPLEICQRARQRAMAGGYDIMLVDTAGRLHIDEPLMEELQELKGQLHPKEILLVADAMTGQDAVNIAKAFNDVLDIDGVILTKMEGDARGGAALSIKGVTGKPIKFIGTGEKLDALEVFHPDRMASRILGMGDILSVIEKAQASFDEKEAEELERKLIKEAFSLEDFRDQIRRIKKMGSIENILNLIPGPGIGRLKGLKGIQFQEQELVKIEAIINSMTPKERRNHGILNGSRRLRIAKGSGTTVQDVNRLLKQYTHMLKVMRKVRKGGTRELYKMLRI
ncbi:MAG: signal recognition particle protein [Syntrophobacterales bacterium]|nr:MAG: signal recognition particle protein [Syntrophobacterales bacterium]